MTHETSKKYSRKSKKFLEFNESENTSYLWNTAKAVIRGKVKAMNVYIKNKQKSRYLKNNLMIYLLEE
jgi:hypothetical protein